VAELRTDGLERRQLDLRGKSVATDVFVLTSANSQHQQL
jgi:ribosomal silencing factor RsfS